MKKQCKEYRYKKNTVFSLLVAAFLFFILAFIMGFLEDDLAFRIPGICSLLVGILFIFMFVHAMRTSPLITTEDEIIFSKRPFARTLHIPVKDIVKVKIQMDRSFRAGVLVWYHYSQQTGCPEMYQYCLKIHGQGDQHEGHSRRKVLQRC